MNLTNRSRGELAKRIGDLCRDIIIQHVRIRAWSVPDDVALAEALLRVVTAWNTHGTTAPLDPVALAYFERWKATSGSDGGAFDSDAFRSGALDMHQRVADALVAAFPDDWQPIDE